jgi:hypothetical protein
MLTSQQCFQSMSPFSFKKSLKDPFFFVKLHACIKRPILQYHDELLKFSTPNLHLCSDVKILAMLKMYSISICDLGILAFGMQQMPHLETGLHESSITLKANLQSL